MKILFALFILLMTNTAYSASFKNLLFSPGDLISAHQKFDDECQQCHSEFSKDKQTPLCLDCHKAIKKDLENNLSFHGLDPKIKQQECKTCHSDHQGRDFNAVIFDIDAFNHQLTNFPLKDKHADLSCSLCHLNKSTFRIEQQQCNDCHKEQDIHQGKMGSECATCHNSQGWSDTEFDHNKTQFPLKNKHESVACGRCHLTHNYKEAPKQCASCHALQDIHAGKMKEDCGQCHSEKSWRGALFDHTKRTDFPLNGKHKDLPCDSCHLTENKKDNLPTQCSGCHAKDDIHSGEFGTKCAGCHQEKTWLKVTFDHNKNTDFQLSGKHASLNCRQCHGSQGANLSMFAGLLKTAALCSDCHEKDDPHNKTLGSQCESCHNQKTWSSALFNHDLTRFPLIGIHKDADCTACHLSKNFQGAPTDCKSCHTNMDPHKPSFGEDCQQCHNPNDWRMWLFDHSQKTDYPLEGAHKNLQCKLCHNESLTPSSRCFSCHRQNDVHRGAFGQQCQQCHNNQSFKHEFLRK